MAGADVEAVDLTLLQQILARHKGSRGALIPILQQAQEAYGFLPKQVLVAIASGLGMPLSQIYGVVTFYAQFYLHRRGKHIIRTCDGTACHVRGSAKIIESVEKEIGIRAGQTSSDYEFTYEVVYCLGSCGLSPVAVIDDKVVGRLTPERLVSMVHGLRRPSGAAAAS
ncbi:MAG: NADH-quinone oxidoreductase subunit NuoE [Chloroflexi bacterium]|nr:NADH-quinone oxidoreductase subunit NuoE [Chloroflexota bacterium]MCL5107688.1 NADH-quinone oxidoreductase subunit NuoE [Chloroflexota bacterium]